MANDFILSVSDAFIGQHDLHRSDIKLTYEVFTSRQCKAQTEFCLMSDLNELFKCYGLNPAHIIALSLSVTGAAAASDHYQQ